MLTSQETLRSRTTILIRRRIPSSSLRRGTRFTRSTLMRGPPSLLRMATRLSPLTTWKTFSGLQHSKENSKRTTNSTSCFANCPNALMIRLTVVPLSCLELPGARVVQRRRLRRFTKCSSLKDRMDPILLPTTRISLQLSKLFWKFRPCSLFKSAKISQKHHILKTTLCHTLSKWKEHWSTACQKMKRTMSLSEKW